VPSFRTAVGYTTGSGTNGVAVADLNGDGKPDLAAAVRGRNSVGVLLGRGDGAFGAATTYAVGGDPFNVAVADLNGDGKPDLVTPNRLGNDVSVLLGHGDGTFGAPTGYATGWHPNMIAMVDLDGDGKFDLVTADHNGNSVSALLGRGDGTFGAATTYAAGRGPTDVAVADLNGDGRPDLVTANNDGNSVSVLRGISPRLVKYFDFIDRYTSPTPTTLPKLRISLAEREALRQRIGAFVESLERGEGPKPLVLTGDDLNALVVTTEAEGRVRFVVEENLLKGQVSVPLDELGIPGMEGRYVNGEATFRVSLQRGDLIVAIASAEINGRPIPAWLLAELREKNLAESFARQPQIAAGLDRLERIRIKDEKIVIEARLREAKRPLLPLSVALQHDQTSRSTLRVDIGACFEQFYL
jgi:hypothetical protein